MFDLIEKFFAVNNCPSENLTPSIDNCNNSQLRKLSFIFHPDRNPSCIDDATAKFQDLSNQYDDICSGRTRPSTNQPSTTQSKNRSSKDKNFLSMMLLSLFLVLFLIFFIIMFFIIKKSYKLKK
jgi:hypothetical protein